MIEMLQTVSDVKILSQPSVVLTVGKGESRIENNVRIPYETSKSVGTTLASVTEYKDSGVTMKVNVPQVSDDLIQIDLEADITQLTGFINVGVNTQSEPMSVPTLDSRYIKSSLWVPDGVVFIAGLMKTTRRYDNSEGVPWLGELPILKYLFNNQSKQQDDAELVLLVKPEILTPYQEVASGQGE